MKTKRRSESFFGMHFDFHAGREQRGIGSNSDPATLRRLMAEVKPDYVQCDTKGHVGASSYPTKVGNPAPGIEKDILRMWREVTAEYGVALYAHHSGVWDNFALERHPEWAAVDEKGVPSKERTSVFGPYAKEQLAPQLKEMALDYGLDGAWVDGECWAQIVDYSHWATDAYREATGLEAPHPGEDGYEQYLEFNREGFRKYLASYIADVKSDAPEFQIASNWMYTSFVPEEKTIPVDFISGDYSPSDSVNTARFEAYCLANQPQPWDLMAWGFNIQNGHHCVKSLPQLCQEAAVVISVGGGFQVYNRQLVGTVQAWAIPMWAKLAEFCRERERFCHKARLVPDVAVIHSTAAFYHNKKNLFTAYGCPVTRSLRGCLFSLLDNGYSAEVLMTHQVGESLSRFGMVVVPDIETIEPELMEKLTAYVEAGGTLVAVGEHSASLFAELLGLEACERLPEAVLSVPGGGAYGTVKSGRVSFVPADGTEVVAEGFANMDGCGEPKAVLATRRRVGLGSAICVCFDAGESYVNDASAALRDFMGERYAAYARPKLRVIGSHLVEAALTEKDGHTYVNLLNLAGAHSDEKLRSFDEIPPICDIELEVALDKPVTAALAEPEHLSLIVKNSGTVSKIFVPRLDIHTVIELFR